MTAFWVFALAGVGTYFARSLFILALGERRLPDVLETALRYVGPAVLAALTVSILVGDGVAEFLVDVPAVAATAVAVVTALRARSFLTVLGVAMAVLWLLELAL